MKYAIDGLTKDAEYVIGVTIIADHKGIAPEEFERGVDNVFETREDAEVVLEKLKLESALGSCLLKICEVE